jgi:tetratricopeptide (TPR) repeat protein
LRVLHQALLALGRLQEAISIADELEPLARKIGQSSAFASCLNTRVWAEFGKAPDLVKLKTGLQQLPKSDQKGSYPFLDVFSEIQLSLVDFFRGSWADALWHARAACRSEVESSVKGIAVGTLFRHMAYAGDRDGALAILQEKRAWLPLSAQHNIVGSWYMLALLIEGLVMLGEHSQVAQLYPLARELLGTGMIALWPIFRLSQTIAGVAAAAGRQWEAAEEHLQMAMQQAESLPYRLEQTELRRFHAMMLIDRSGVGDRDKAQTLLNEALQSYERIGMPRHIEMTQALLDRAVGLSK